MPYRHRRALSEGRERRLVTSIYDFENPKRRTKVTEVPVEIGPQFLNLFSEHLYSSPNKAFEELVSNSWDAGARHVYIRVPDELDDENAAIWVLDDGMSMDIAGFRLSGLWRLPADARRVRLPGANQLASSVSASSRRTC